MSKNLCILLALPIGLIGGNEVPARVADKVPDRFEAAVFDAVRAGGYLGDRLRVNLDGRLLQANVEELLDAYKHRPGRQAWIGEHAAKFIEAASTTWSYTQHPKLKAILDETVTELLATQEPDGYLGTYESGKRWRDWDVWTQKYVLLGLLSYYKYTGSAPALDGARKVGDLLVKTFGDRPGQINIVVGDAHKGMASSSVLEPMVMLYRFTGNVRYLNFCRYITRAWETPPGPQIISTLMRTGSVREVANGKAYEMISNLVGLVDLYRLTGDSMLLKPVEVAWQDIVTKRLYSTGSAGWGGRFQDDNQLRADDKDEETGVGDACVTVTWMQLNLHLLRLTGESRYADEIERSVYNALLGAQHPKNGSVSYFTPLIGKKRYGGVNQGFPGVNCCSSSLPRGLNLIPFSALGRLGNSAVVNLYMPATARISVSRNGDPLNISLSMETNFPKDGRATLDVSPSAPGRFSLALRVPSWCASFAASVEGQTYTGKPGEYLIIDREWKDAARVEIRIDMSPRLLDGGPSYPNQVGIARGPQVLALDEAFGNGDRLWLSGVRLGEDRTVRLEEYSGKLPENWAGSQAYVLEGYVGNDRLPKKPTKLVLTPVADAGQQGSEYRVWMQASPQ